MATCCDDIIGFEGISIAACSLVKSEETAMTDTTYNYKVVRQFAIMTVVWGIVGMLVGVIIAAQLAFPTLLDGIPWLSYGRLRPLHTNAVIFAFGGSALFATSYYVVQRTCQARLFGGGLAAFTFWGWNLIIVLAALSLPLGFTSGKEYAELEWPIDLLIAVVWVSYALVFFGTIMKRRVKHIYVANWFYGAFILTIAPHENASKLAQVTALHESKEVTPNLPGLFGGVADILDWIALILMPVFAYIGIRGVKVAPMEFQQYRKMAKPRQCAPPAPVYQSPRPAAKTGANHRGRRRRLPDRFRRQSNARHDGRFMVRQHGLRAAGFDRRG